MGNTSCTSNGGATIKVVREDGRVEEHRGPIKAGEIMHHNPGLFVCDSGYLHVGHRVPGLAADDELEAHRRYYLLHMDMLYSVLTEEEMGIIQTRCSGGAKGKQRLQVNPVGGVEYEDHVVWSQGSWRPALDTIDESPCLL